MADTFVPLSEIEENNDTSWYTAAAAGIASGLIKIPEGVFSLAAELIDLGADSNTAASVEQFFDKINPFEEVADDRAIGKLTEVLTSIGIPGAAGFKAATSLADKAMKLKRAGKYTSLKNPNIIKGAVQADKLNKRAGAKRFGAGILGGAAGETLVADVEEIGTFGDFFDDSAAGMTALDRDEELEGREDAARKLMNRFKFGSESVFITPFVYGAGKGAKALATRGQDLAYSNSRFERFVNKVGSAFRPEGALSKELHLSGMLKEGLKAADLNRANELVRKITRAADKMFPSIETIYDKSLKSQKDMFMKKINDAIFDGDLSKPAGKKFDEVAEMMQARKLDDANQTNIRTGVNEARGEFARLVGMIDSMSPQKAKVKNADELKGIMKERVSKLIGNTYKIFEDKPILGFRKYTPTDEAMTNAINLMRRFIAKNVKKKDPNATFNPDSMQYYQEAREMVDDIINQVSKQKKPGALPDFTYTNKTMVGEVGKKSFDKAVGKGSKVFRELFGEIEDPRYALFNGITRLSNLARTNAYLNEIATKNADVIARGGRGFFWNSADAARAATNNVAEVVRLNPLMSRVTMNGKMANPLADMWTTKDIANGLANVNNIQTGLAAVVRGKEGATAAEKAFSFLWRYGLVIPKGLSQLAKTVLSIPTHVRNFMSAGAFAGANGILWEAIPGIGDPKLLAKSFKDGVNISGLINLTGKGPVAEKAYREALELGITNSQVQIGDLKALMKDAFNYGDKIPSTDGILRSMLSKLKKIPDFLQGKYIAEDDTWKLTNYFVELARRDKAYRAKGIVKTPRELKLEAANIVKNTVPNYAYVGDIVKTARLLPVGNFMSFPSEMIRTTTNIAELGLNEMKHSKPTIGSNVLPYVMDRATKRMVANDNPMYGIGFKRLTGLATTLTVVPTAMVEGAKAIYDVAEDEINALRRFVPEWSKNSTLIPIRDEDGGLSYVDFSHTNAYDVIGRPFRTLINNIQDGMMNDETLLSGFVNGVNEAGGELMDPFISESIWTEAVTDLTVRRGRTADGRQLYTDETSAGDKAAIRFLHLGNALLPGGVKQYERFYKAGTKTPTERGKELELSREALGLIGLRPIKVEPLDSMGFKISEFQGGIRNARREFTGGAFGLLKGGPVTPNQIIERYLASNASRFEVMQKMYNDITAAGILGVDPTSLRREFSDRQISPATFNKLERGQYIPFYPSRDIQLKFRENANDLGMQDPFVLAAPVLRQINNDMKYLDLNQPFELSVSDYIMREEPEIATPTFTPQQPVGINQGTPLVYGNQQTISGGQTINPQTLLTATETALLSPDEQAIRIRQRNRTV